MSHEALDFFSGTTPIFPLPNLVLYPQVMQPLHIFEPRYRQMTKDALDGERILGMALLKPGWEHDYEKHPRICPQICLATIVADQLLEDGRYNLLVRGISRGRIVQEIESEKLYRIADVTLEKDVTLEDVGQEVMLRDALRALVPHWFQSQPKVLEEFQKILSSDLPLGTMCDIITFALPLPVEFKQAMLGEVDVERRAYILIEKLKGRNENGGNKKFPPEFSPN